MNSSPNWYGKNAAVRDFVDHCFGCERKGRERGGVLKEEGDG